MNAGRKSCKCFWEITKGELVKEENFRFSDSEAAERLLIKCSKVDKREFEFFHRFADKTAQRGLREDTINAYKLIATVRCLKEQFTK